MCIRDRYYVVLASVTNKILVAVIAFGLNSAAYVAEIVRSGIMSVDIGQFEAGRSLGLNYRQTMKLVIIPQAVKNILPALLNEFISLLKETSISGYIGMMDLTKGGDIIRSNTYEAFIPVSYTHLDVYKRQAIDIVKSGTRREDLLLDEDEQAAVDNMRKAFNGMRSDEAVENVLNMFAHTKSNKEFVNLVKKNRIL